MVPLFSLVSARFGSETNTPHRHEGPLLLPTRNFRLIATTPVSVTLNIGPTLPVVMSVIVVVSPPPPAPELAVLPLVLLALELLANEPLLEFWLPGELEPPAPPVLAVDDVPSLRQPARDDHTMSTLVSVPMLRK